jgi:O-antigen/teichoic acid export membrane protein
LMPSRDDETDRLSRDGRIFLQKTARSIVEIQPDLHSIADIEIFLEVLGYTQKMAVENGFQDLHHLARSLYGFIDHYSDPERSREAYENTLLFPITKLERRLAEGLSGASPWLGALIVLFFFGVSTWLAWGLPLSVTTLFILGVYIGIIVSEGPLQIFNRLFTFYYNQSNLPEVRRILKRSYYVLAIILAATLGAIYAFGVLANIPAGILGFALVAAATISFHRVSYVPIYALKRARDLLSSYLLAFVTLLAIYFLLPGFIPYAATRYLVGLVAAVMILSIAPIYRSYGIFTAQSISPIGAAKSRSTSPLIMNKSTIRSRFGMQLWETAPFYFFGTFSLLMLFGDRIISWVFNPNHIANGVLLPLAFNATYEIGADLALLVLFPVTIIQYVIMAPIFEQLSNLAVTKKSTEVRSIDQFLKRRYEKLLMISLGSALLIAACLIILAPQIIMWMGGSKLTVQILQVAAFSDILMAVFSTNAVFMVFLNRINSLVVIAIVGALLVTIGGVTLAQFGFERIIFAYLISASTVALLSSLQMRRDLRRAGSLFFSKYI